MLTKSGLLVACVAGVLSSPGVLQAQATPPTPAPQSSPATPGGQGPAPPGEHRVGGFVPGQKRSPGDPAQIARGTVLFEMNCRGCHGPDLRGGDLGGPNLLRSQVALSDQNGELIGPIVHGSRQDMGMPAVPLNDADANAVAAYVRSVIATIGRQGTPPSAGKAAPSILVGNASEGKSYFAVKCASCHSPTGDLQGIAARIADPKALQTTWVAGGERGPHRPAAGDPDPRTPKAEITLSSGEKVEGELVHIDDFLVTVQLPDGTQRTIRRNGSSPQIAVQDPMKAHRSLLAEYTDKDIHDVTAYLVTLK
jgi:cytochrome c oxidase cbb3-type subunit III